MLRRLNVWESDRLIWEEVIVTLGTLGLGKYPKSDNQSRCQKPQTLGGKGQEHQKYQNVNVESRKGEGEIRRIEGRT